MTSAPDSKIRRKKKIKLLLLKVRELTYSWDEHIELHVPLTRVRDRTIGIQLLNICIQLDVPHTHYVREYQVLSVEILDYKTKIHKKMINHHSD